MCDPRGKKRSIDICAPLEAISNISVLCVLNFLVTRMDEFWLVEVDKRLRNFGRGQTMFKLTSPHYTMENK
jgi:hypothetical protein